MKAAENHRKFLSHLDNSADAVWRVAQMLSGRGYSVTVPAASRARVHGEWQDHADAGDLYISQRVEVKQLGAEFSSASDWPFGKHFIVCAKHAFDRARPRPHSYVILSASGNTAACVLGSDHKNWYVEKRKDRRYEGVEQEFYFSPLEMVQFFQMPKDL